LSEQDVAAVREEVAAGRTVTVWFTAAAVGVPTGGSAKVLALGDVPEGDFVQVRPAGSKDAVFCAPGELTRTKPARRTTARRKAGASTEEQAATPQAPPTPAPPARPARARRTPEPAVPPAAPAPAPEETLAPKPAPARPRRRAERTGALTVTLTSTVEGDWSVEVQAGAKRVVPATPVPPADVAALSRSLPPVAAEAVASSLAEARRRQEERVATLRAELDAAQRTLDQFGGD
jgi:hypothetical protein